MLDTEERYGDDRHTKSYPKRKLLPEFDDEAVPPKTNTTRRSNVPLPNHDRTATDIAHNIHEHLIRKSARPGPSTDLKDTPRRGTMVTKMMIQAKYQFGINTRHNNSRLHATACPDTEGMLTPCASPKKYWTMNSHKVLNL